MKTAKKTAKKAAQAQQAQLQLALTNHVSSSWQLAYVEVAQKKRQTKSIHSTWRRSMPRKWMVRCVSVGFFPSSE